MIMGLSEALTTEKHLMMLTRLLRSCPAHAVTKAVLRERMDKHNKYKMTTYRLVDHLIRLGYVVEVEVKGRILYKVQYKELLGAFYDLPITTSIVLALEKSGKILRVIR